MSAVKKKQPKIKQPVGTKLNGTMFLECSECGEGRYDVEVKNGAIVLDDDWVWFELKCNWGNEKMLRLLCIGCAMDEHGYKDDER